MGNLIEDVYLKGKIQNNYEIIEKIDTTSFAINYKCKDKRTNTLEALKVINKKNIENIFGVSKKDMIFESIKKEIDCLKICDGDYSLRLIDFLETKECFYIVTELWNTNLEQHVINLNSGLTIKEIKEIFNKLNIGLKQMIEKNIIHCDLKLNTILIKYENEEVIPKISGYGKEILLTEDLPLPQWEKFYNAPEILRNVKYDYKIDLWSIGIILYRLYFNEFPYDGTYNSILNKKSFLKCEDNDSFNDLIKNLLTIDPAERITWDEYFNHPFWTSKDPESSIEEDEEYSDCLDSKINHPPQKKTEEIDTSLKTKKTINADDEKQKNNEKKIKEKKTEPEKKNYNEVRNENIDKKKDENTENLDLNSEPANNNENKKGIILRGKNNKANLKDHLSSKYNIYYEENNSENNKVLRSEVNIDKNTSKINLASELIKNIRDKDLTKLILYSCNLNNLSPFVNVSFINLEELCLAHNELENIEIFTDLPFRNLKVLNLNYNHITNIDPLENVPFQSLSTLSISNNKIENIDVLSKVPFRSLDKLNLSSNLIKNMDVFQDVPFTNLTVLNLNDNKITDNKNSLVKISLNNLHSLDLHCNKLRDISGLNSKKFSELTYLNLGGNNIVNIKVFLNVHFNDLENLLLFDNRISDINVLSNVPFVNLKELNLSYNEIKKLEVFSNVPFKNLRKLDLSGNNIRKIEAMSRMPVIDLRELYLKDNKIPDNEDTNDIIEMLRNKYKNIQIK